MELKHPLQPPPRAVLLTLDVLQPPSFAEESGELFPEEEEDVEEESALPASSFPGSSCGTWLLQKSLVSLESSGLL